MPLYTVQNLHFAFAEQPVLNIPQLTIAEGKITALTGPNGSGKTTLLMLLGAQLWPSDGQIVYRGQRLPGRQGKQVDRIRREIGFVLQAPYLFRASVERNVAYGLAVRGMPRAQRQMRVGQALRSVGLANFELRPRHALSVGEAQRVALARALAAAPRTLLLDEPLANVDAMSQTIIERVLMNENSQRQVSVLFTTHDLDQAYRLADEVVTLNAGMVVQGAMENVFHGRVYQQGANWLFDTGHLAITIPARHAACRTAVIPPQAILLSKTKIVSSARNRLRGRVIAIRERHASVEISVDVGETFIARITDVAYRDMDLRLGQDVYLIFKAEAVRLC